MQTSASDDVGGYYWTGNRVLTCIKAAVIGMPAASGGGVMVLARSPHARSHRHAVRPARDLNRTCLLATAETTPWTRNFSEITRTTSANMRKLRSDIPDTMK